MAHSSRTENTTRQLKSVRGQQSELGVVQKTAEISVMGTHFHSVFVNTFYTSNGGKVK